MKSSATNTAFALLVAAAALGAAVFACTTTSSTDTDTDGGSGTSSSGSSGTSSSGSSGNPADTGAASCSLTHTPNRPISSESCMSCIKANCCTPLQACFDVDADIDCNDYSDCIEQCNDQDGGDDCTDTCDTAAGGAQSAIATAYAAVAACANSKCRAATDCNIPDAGQ